MKQVGRYNNLSKEFLDKLAIKPLLPNDRAVFRSTRELLDPEDKKGTTVMYNVTGETIPPTDQIYDTEAKAMVDIGTVLSVDKDGKPERVIKFSMKPNKKTGEFYLYGSNEDHQYVYWYLQICNYNKLNPNRFTHKEAMFFEVDEDTEAKNIIKKKSQKFEVEKYVLECSDGDLKRIALALGWGDTKSPNVLRKEVFDFASSHADTFEAMIRDTKTIESKSIIKKAFDLGILEWSEVERTVTLSNNVIATLARVEGKQKHEQLDEFLKTTRNGDKIYENVKKLVQQKAA